MHQADLIAPESTSWGLRMQGKGVARTKARTNTINTNPESKDQGMTIFNTEEV